MSISRRKKGKSHHHHHKRRRLGGYISGNTDRGVGFDKTIEARERDRRKKEAPKFSLFSIPTWVDYKVNKGKVDESSMENIAKYYASASTPTQRESAREMLKDALIVNDINQNSDEYLREWLKGKHKKNNWAKWLTRLGLGAAGVAGAYGLYQYGVPYIGNLLATKAPGIVSAAKALFTADAGAQGALPEGTSAAATDGNIDQVVAVLKKIGKDKPEVFAQLYDMLGLNPNTTSTGSGYRRRRKVKRRKHHHHKR